MDKERWPLTWDVADDPMALASEYLDERLNPSDRNAIDLAIRDKGGFRMTREDWQRFGDRNHLDRRIERAWISRGSTPLDVTAVEVSGVAGFEVTPQDLIEHALSFPDGKSWEYVSPRGQELRERYMGLTGRWLDRRTARLLFRRAMLSEREPPDDCPF